MWDATKVGREMTEKRKKSFLIVTLLANWSLTSMMIIMLNLSKAMGYDQFFLPLIGTLFWVTIGTLICLQTVLLIPGE